MSGKKNKILETVENIEEVNSSNIENTETFINDQEEANKEIIIDTPEEVKSEPEVINKNEDTTKVVVNSSVNLVKRNRQNIN